MVEFEDISKRIERYREIAEKEMREELAPRPRVKSYTRLDLLNPERPHFSPINRDNSKYVVAFRLVRFCKLSKIVGDRATDVLWYSSGKDLGTLS